MNFHNSLSNFSILETKLFRKFLEAKGRGHTTVTLWGNGSASREFLYVEDCAEAIRLAASRYNGAAPVNIGTGCEIKIRDLAKLIKTLTQYKGRIKWDKTRPNGQMRRRLNTDLAKRYFGFRSKTTLEAGLKTTLEWYLTHQ